MANPMNESLSTLLSAIKNGGKNGTNGNGNGLKKIRDYKKLPEYKSKVNQINGNGAETNAYQTYFTGFAATGPTFASNDIGTNQTGSTYAALCWRSNGGTTATNTSGTISSTVQVNQNSGLAIVEYTGNGSNGATVGHGLGKKLQNG